MCLPAELLGNDAERIAELAAEPGVLGPVDADRPELMVCEHCLLTAEGVCATDATGQVRCRDCLCRRQVRYLVERDGTRLPVAVDACGRTRIFPVVGCRVASVCYHMRVYGLPAPPYPVRVL